MQLSTDKYKIVRHYKRNYARRTIETGLTLAEAQAHCKDPDTSSKTAWSAKAHARTKRHGAWFDGYDKE
jgi:hypothetical protein